MKGIRMLDRLCADCCGIVNGSIQQHTHSLGVTTPNFSHELSHYLISRNVPFVLKTSREFSSACVLFVDVRSNAPAPKSRMIFETLQEECSHDVRMQPKKWALIFFSWTQPLYSTSTSSDEESST